MDETAKEILDATCTSSDKDVVKDFEGKRIIEWAMWSESYEEGVCVVARDDAGAWYFLEHSHCSCAGFEDMSFEDSHPDAILAKQFYCYDKADIDRLLAAVREEVAHG